MQYYYEKDVVKIKKSKEEMDLGVTVTENLTLDRYIGKITREMKTVIQDQNSSWLEVTCGVPQGSVLGLVMFVMYVNGINEEIDSYMNLFVDDAKLIRRVENVNDCIVLQDDLNKINLGKWNSF